MEEVRRDSGRWIFVDIGFSQSASTCGLLRHEGAAECLPFGGLVSRIVEECSSPGEPLNLLIEAPLSVAFTREGHPSGRSVERRQGQQPRYWYLGLGCGVMVAAMHLVRAMCDRGVARDVRLFEGFASFKQKGIASSHTADVEKLREIVWHPEAHPRAIVGPRELKLSESDTLTSAFHVMGMNLGVPPVIVVDG